MRREIVITREPIDEAALAGAMQLPPLSDGTKVCSQAAYYEHQNSTSTDSRNMVVDSNLDTSYCQIIGNSVLTEIVFNRPGLGKIIVGALNQRDYTMLQGLMVIYCFLIVVVNLLTDVTYGLIDPRVKQA